MLGNGSVNHNSCKFKAENVDGERSQLNVDYCNENIKKVYHKLFDEALQRYNEKQTRSDRRISDYYEKIRNSKQEKSIGLWGQRHLQYLKEHKQFVYLNLLTSGRLNEYLACIDEQAEDMYFQLVREYAERQGVTEQLKEEKQLLWIQKMNNIRACVREVVENDVICL